MGKTLGGGTVSQRCAEIGQENVNSPMLVCPDMRRVSALRNNAGVGPDSAIGIQLLPAVGLVVILALSAVEAGVALSSDTHALAFLDQGHLGADTDGRSNDFLDCQLDPVSHWVCCRTVANREGELLVAPATVNGVYIASADTAALDLDIDIIVAKGLGLELVLVKFEPGVRPVDLEASELLGIRHGGWEMARFARRTVKIKLLRVQPETARVNHRLDV